MESQTDHGPLNEREPHHTSVGPGHQTVAEGDQGEPHHEKKSVFTKVKARAKKMKDTITGHGQGLDEEGDEDDQEKFEDPQIHDSSNNFPAARNEDLPTSVAGRETFDRTKPQEHDHELGADHRPSKQSSSYTDKFSSPTTGIAADKAVSDKNVEASTFGFGDKDNTIGVQDHEGVGGRPSSDQSSYTQKISSATSAITDRAVSAKNLVASKLGYGEKDNEVPGTGTFGTANQQQQQRGVGGNNQEKGGGGSVKGYLAEKLKPGEEDKALSEVITETLNKRKPEQQQKQEAAPRPVGEVISDAMRKRNDNPDGEVNSRPMGKVTESDEVARRLGDTKDDQAPGNKGMVDKIKGAVGSWLGTGDQSPGSQPGPARDDTGHKSN
ncbi:hypothetical protein LWI29_022961 [Acer saccharum]|uniref:Uncharacterized protein n=1 Tax=Acer saccharum TaxID=4024 RepID=A0AA39SN71_ACESA|nr:hypothetical protein LWI29_022961 [Acer saccharum]